MKKIISIASIFLCLILFTSFNIDKVGKWKLEKNKNGITVYSLRKEGESLKQIKVITKVKTPLSAAVSVLADVSNYTDWIYNCSDARVLNRVNKYEMNYYMISDVPWPIENRDMALHNKIYQNKETKVVYSVSAPKNNVVPKKKGMVRIMDMESKWKFTPLKDGYVSIEYYLKMDPGGSVPHWIINLFIEKGPYQSIFKFREALKSEKHKKANFNFIDEVKN